MKPYIKQSIWSRYKPLISLFVKFGLLLLVIGFLCSCNNFFESKAKEIYELRIERDTVNLWSPVNVIIHEKEDVILSSLKPYQFKKVIQILKDKYHYDLVQEAHDDYLKRKKELDDEEAELKADSVMNAIKILNIK